jgi:2-keto-4-pentenoate hydratase/2-oxohepta-3-ene-1,7-dioic acid hydratase in catechol pathway
LRAGDMIITGSPAGNGSHYGRFLRDGDLVEATITGLGEQRNRVVGRTGDLPPWYADRGLEALTAP